MYFILFLLSISWRHAGQHTVVPLPKSWNIFLHLYVVCISLQYVPFEIYFYIYLIVLYVILNIKLPLVFIKRVLEAHGFPPYSIVNWLYALIWFFPFFVTSREKIFAKQRITDVYISSSAHLFLSRREKKSHKFYWTTLFMFLQTYQSIIIWIFPCNNCNQISSTIFSEHWDLVAVISL